MTPAMACTRVTLLDQRRPLLEATAKRLLAKETLEEAELRQLVQEHQAGDQRQTAA
jgi:hypothetical protein